MNTSSLVDLEEEIIRGVLGCDATLIAKGIQYGMMFNKGLIDLMAPSIELISGVNLASWVEGSLDKVRWAYKVDWLLPPGYSICIDHRLRLGNTNALKKCIHVPSHHKFEWDLCKWYYTLKEPDTKGVLVSCSVDQHLLSEVRWLEKGINRPIRVVELPNVYSFDELSNQYQLGIYDVIDLVDRIKVRSNILYYLSHPKLLDNLGRTRVINVNSVSKY